jgi:type IV secretion system protein VirB2
MAHWKQRMALGVVAVLLAVQGPQWALAQMPWEAPLDTITQSFSGPVATAVMTLAIIGLGFALAFGAMHSVLGWGFMLVLGGAIVMSAATLVGSMFGGGG